MGASAAEGLAPPSSPAASPAARRAGRCGRQGQQATTPRQTRNCMSSVLIVVMVVSLACGYFTGGNTVFQSFFMLTTVQPFATASSQPLSKVCELVAPVGRNSRPRRRDGRRAQTAHRCRPRSTATSAGPVRVAERGDGPAAVRLWMATGCLPCRRRTQSRATYQDWHALAHLELQLAGASDDLLRRDAVDPFRPPTHELTPPPDAMNVLNPLARRNVSSSTIG